MSRKGIFGALFMSLIFLPAKNWPAVDAGQELKHEVVVTLKLVQVYVTDKDGKPITDLGKNDFLIYDNGQPQSITDFESHNLLQTSPLAEVQLAETPGLTPKETAARINRKFFILFDYEQNDSRGVAKSKKAALQFVDTQMRPGDEVAVLSYSPIRGMVVHEYLQTDRGSVRDAISKLRDVPAKTSDEVVRKINESGFSIGRLTGEADFQTDAQAFFEGRSEGELGRANEITRIKLFFQEVRNLAKSLRYVPGNKNIVLFSSGIRATLLFGGFEPHMETAGDQFEDMIRELAASGCPVYAVHSSGALDRLSSIADRGDQSLRLLSEKTGGRYFADASYAEEIATRIHQLTAHYYILGYPVPEKWDGRFHELKVEVKRPGSQIHAPAGYFSAKPFRDYTEFEKHLHLIDLALSERPALQERLSFPLTALPWSDGQQSGAVLIAEISREALKDVVGAKSELYILAWDRERKTAISSRGEASLAALKQTMVYLYSVMALPPGEYEVRVVLRNMETGKGALGSSSFETSGPQDSGLRMDVPLLLLPEQEASYVRIKDSRRKEGGLSLQEIYPLLPKRAAPVMGTLGETAGIFLGAFRFSTPAGQKPNLRFSALMTDVASQAAVPLKYSLLSSQAKPEGLHLLVEFQVPTLKPGRYALECGAVDLTSGASASQTTFLDIR